MNCEQANAISIVDYLTATGFEAKKSSRGQSWHLSPLRSETKPSLKVDVNRNIWHDYGQSEGGRLVDLVCKSRGVEVKEALRIIEGVMGGGMVSTKQAQYKKPSAEENQQQTKLVKVQILTHPALIQYCTNRSIPLEIANKFLQECHYQLPGRAANNFALGFKNNSGGYELRNKDFQSCLGKKDITLIKTGEEQVVSVFEGFFDFLSALAISRKVEPTHHVLVLNSLSLLNKALPQLRRYEKVNLYLDNDRAGQNAVTSIKAVIRSATDQSRIYEKHKDFNDYLITLKNG